MSTWLLVAAAIAVFLGIAHSYLGEKYILIRLLRRQDLPKLRGSDWFTKRTLRLAWHLTSVAWWGFALILWELARPEADALSTGVARAIVLTFLASTALALGFARGRHLSWALFLAIALLTWLVLL